MSQHFADCLYGDSVAEGDAGSEGMPCHVVSQVLCYLGFFCDLLEYDATCAVIPSILIRPYMGCSPFFSLSLFSTKCNVYGGFINLSISGRQT